MASITPSPLSKEGTQRQETRSAKEGRSCMEGKQVRHEGHEREIERDRER
jgi:hypothetical protein